MSFRSRSDGSHYPVRGRSLYHPARSKLYHKNIRYASEAEVRESIAFANKHWAEDNHKQRVHLLRAMNEAANRCEVMSRNQRLSEHERRKAETSHRMLRTWVDEHKGREGQYYAMGRKTPSSKLEIHSYRTLDEAEAGKSRMLREDYHSVSMGRE